MVINRSPSLENLTTIKQLFDYAKSCFCVFQDPQDAKVDAQVLLASVLDKPRSYLLTWPDNVVPETARTVFFDFIKRRETGEPIAYIIGKREFWSLEFLVAPCTLIPRPDTEILIESVLDNNTTEKLSLLDLGTGTGAIALALASEQVNWHVEAVDYQADAVALATTNAKQLGLERVKVYQSDWFSHVEADNRFNVIVSNPPYIDEQDEHLSEGDVRFEPLSALVAKNNGYADIISIIEQAPKYLVKNGQLYLEHGFEQHQEVQRLLKDNGYINVKTFYDYGGNPRITMGYFDQ